MQWRLADPHAHCELDFQISRDVKHLDTKARTSIVLGSDACLD
jgi:hypothetical protein